MIATIGKEKLTDGSYVYYVLCAENEVSLKFDCVDLKAATTLIEALNGTVNVSTY